MKYLWGRNWTQRAGGIFPTLVFGVEGVGVVSPVLPGAPVSSHREVVAAEDQPQYLNMPVIVSPEESGVVTSRWHLTWRARLRVLISGNLWLQMMCFGQGITPSKLLTREPSLKDCGLSDRR